MRSTGDLVEGDGIVVIGEGGVVEEGSHDELIEREGGFVNHPADRGVGLPAALGHQPVQGRPEQLLTALHDWCAEDAGSQGVVLDTGNPHYLEFYKRQGYEEIGEIAVGPVREHVFFHANPQVLHSATA